MVTKHRYLFWVLALALSTSLLASEKPPPAETTATTTAKLDLNTATEQQLMELPGIGAVTAKKIVAGRPYSSPNDLVKAGIPQRTVDKISPLVTVSRANAPTPARRVETKAEPRTASSSPTKKVDLNTATVKELQELPGIGPASAAKIVSNRPYASADELSKAGISKSKIDKIAPMVTASETQLPATPFRRPGGRATPPSATRFEPETAPVTPPAPSNVPERKAAPAHSDPASAAPGGSGQVWLNTDTNIYHREGDRWYGNTKSGKYVTEEEAIQAGARPSK